jgi:hypothetical protein
MKVTVPNRVRQNSGTKAIAKQSNKLPAAAPREREAIYPFTAEETAALFEIGTQVDWSEPDELESVAGHFDSEARKYRFAAAALRRTGLGQGWQWLIVPGIALGEAAAAEDSERRESKLSPVMGDFVRMHRAFVGGGRLLDRLRGVFERAQPDSDILNAIKAERERLAKANGTLVEFFEEMTASGLLDVDIYGDNVLGVNGAKAAAAAAPTPTDQPKRRRPQAKIGFDLSGEGGLYDYRITIPWPDGASWSQVGDFEPEEFAAIRALADKCGITVSQALNRVWRDYFTQADCGDGVSATPSPRAGGVRRAGNPH